MKKTSIVEEDCGGEQVNSMEAGFMCVCGGGGNAREKLES